MKENEIIKHWQNDVVKTMWRYPLGRPGKDDYRLARKYFYVVYLKYRIFPRGEFRILERETYENMKILRRNKDFALLRLVKVLWANGIEGEEFLSAQSWNEVVANCEEESSDSFEVHLLTSKNLVAEKEDLEIMRFRVKLRVITRSDYKPDSSCGLMKGLLIGNNG